MKIEIELIKIKAEECLRNDFHVWSAPHPVLLSKYNYSE